MSDENNGNYLDYLIMNTYKNTRIRQFQLEKISEHRKKLVDILHNILDKKFNYYLLNQGSYATRTQVNMVGGKDFDVDVGIVFRVKDNKSNPNTIRKYICSLLNKDKNANSFFENIEQTTQCISMNLKEAYMEKTYIDIPIRYEIGVYLEYNNKTYFGMENEWKLDDKENQMEIIKNNLAEYNKMRKIIIFLKCLISGHPYYKIIKSIMITEI